MFLDDYKQFAENGKEIEKLIPTVRVCSQDRGMEFSIEKCTMLRMTNEKKKWKGQNCQIRKILKRLGKRNIMSTC